MSEDVNEVMSEADYRSRRRAALTNRAKNFVRSGMIADLLNELRSQGETLVSFSRRSGVHISTLYEISSGRNAYIRNLTAARILIALNEPLHPDLKRVYQAWERRSSR